MSPFISSQFNKILDSYNISKKSRIGYSFGIGFPPDWGDNTISIRQEDDYIIQEGMCIHLIFGAGDLWGYEFSEAVIVTKTGPELLCKTPRILYLSESKHNFDILSNSDSYVSLLCKYGKYS